MKIVWLKPRSGYVTDLRSVTLWGTICWGIRYLYGNERLKKFIGDHLKSEPDFVISSAFPFKQQGKIRTPFFPNPLRIASELEIAENVERALEKSRLRKKFQKVEFLSAEHFGKFLMGEFSNEDLFKFLLEEHDRKSEHDQQQQSQRLKKAYIPHENFIADSAPKRHDHSMTHNTIDRWRGGTLSLPDSEGNTSGQLFHANDIWWSDPHDETEDGEPKTGLFFLVEENRIGSIEDTLAPVLRFLEHWGIGADRTTGKGFFEFNIENFSLPEPPDSEANAMLNLSLFLPKDKEQLAEFENTSEFFPYSLENRECKGWSEAGGFEKNPQLFFAEGSVFHRPKGFSGRWIGCISQNLDDKKLGHPVYDNGIGFMVKLKWPQT